MDPKGKSRPCCGTYSRRCAQEIAHSGEWLLVDEGCVLSEVCGKALKLEKVCLMIGEVLQKNCCRRSVVEVVVMVVVVVVEGIEVGQQGLGYVDI